MESVGGSPIPRAGLSTDSGCAVFSRAENQPGKASMITRMLPMFESEHSHRLVDDAYDGGHGSDLA